MRLRLEALRPELLDTQLAALGAAARATAAEVKVMAPMVATPEEAVAAYAARAEQLGTCERNTAWVQAGGSASAPSPSCSHTAACSSPPRASAPRASNSAANSSISRARRSARPSAAAAGVPAARRDS